MKGYTQQQLGPGDETKRLKELLRWAICNLQPPPGIYGTLRHDFELKQIEARRLLEIPQPIGYDAEREKYVDAQVPPAKKE